MFQFNRGRERVFNFHGNCMTVDGDTRMIPSAMIACKAGAAINIDGAELVHKDDSTWNRCEQDEGNGFKVFNLTAPVVPSIGASAAEPLKGEKGFSLNLAGLKDDSGKPKYSYNDEFLNKASEFSKSWRDQLENDESRFRETI